MNLKNRKGYLGIDVSIALLIMIVLIPMITAITFNINKTNNTLQRKSQAVNIATNIMECAKIAFSEEEESEEAYLSALKDEIETIYEIVPANNESSSITQNANWVENNATVYSNTSILNIVKNINNVLYKIEVVIHDNETNYTVKARVIYPVGSKQEQIYLNTDFIV